MLEVPGPFDCSLKLPVLGCTNGVESTVVPHNFPVIMTPETSQKLPPLQDGLVPKPVPEAGEPVVLMLVTVKVMLVQVGSPLMSYLTFLLTPEAVIV